MAQSGTKRIQELLRAEPEFTAIAASERILTVPLKRPDMDPNAAAMIEASAATPQCFETIPPYWLLPSVSIWTGGAPTSGQFFRGRYMAVTYTLAFYAGPIDYEETLLTMRNLAATVLHRETVNMGGVKGSLWSDADLSSIVPVPEFPGAGYMLLERFGGIGVWRRQ